MEGLPAWSTLHGASFAATEVANIEGKGLALISKKDISTSEDTSNIPTLLAIPHELVLNVETVQRVATEDKDFKQLLDAVENQSARADILLFLLVQLLSTRNSPTKRAKGPWAEYVKFLPEYVPVPTTWTEDERAMLQGTSLENALAAKASALEQDFDMVRERAALLPNWKDVLDAAHLRDWLLVDAWYRSRSLELPRCGEAMVPCIDMANHSAHANAYYEEDERGDVALLLRPGKGVAAGEEITISYGDQKPAAEMLFTYGFLDPSCTADTMVLPMSPSPDDPLARAKMFVFGQPPKLRIERGLNGRAGWACPFVHLSILNEEDGLSFELLQDTDGHPELRMFWQGEDVTGKAGEYETMLQGHELRALFQLRAVVTVQERLQAQLERMQAGPPESRAISVGDDSTVREDVSRAASLLRELEAALLGEAIETLDEERAKLLTDENVVAYLGSMETSQSELAE